MALLVSFRLSSDLLSCEAEVDLPSVHPCAPPHLPPPTVPGTRDGVRLATALGSVAYVSRAPNVTTAPCFASSRLVPGRRGGCVCLLGGRRGLEDEEDRWFGR